MIYSVLSHFIGYPDKNMLYSRPAPPLAQPTPPPRDPVQGHILRCLQSHLIWNSSSGLVFSDLHIFQRLGQLFCDCPSVWVFFIECFFIIKFRLCVFGRIIMLVRSCPFQCNTQEVHMSFFSIFWRWQLGSVG